MGREGNKPTPVEKLGRFNSSPSPFAELERGASKQRFSQCFTSPTICLLVGQSQCPYYLHKDILESKCPFFRARADFLANTDRDECEAISVATELNDGHAFDMFIEYLYKSQYCVPENFTDSETALLHTEVYCLADKFLMDDLKKVAFERASTLLKCFNGWSKRQLPTKTIVELIENVYGGTADQNYWFEKEDEVPESSTKVQGDEEMVVSEKSWPQVSMPSSLGNGPKLPRTKQILDPMRQLICGYAASELESLRLDATFMESIASGGDFAVDLIMALSPVIF